VQLRVPPLRERPEDVVPLAEHFLTRLAQLYNEPAKSIAPDAAAALRAFNWPYNVRELADVVEQAHLASSANPITAAALPEKIMLSSPMPSPAREQSVVPLKVAERNQIIHALRVAEGNQSMAARLLKIRRQRLYRKIELFGLESLTRVASKHEAEAPEGPGEVDEDDE
jgi:DNA-binding NtrC family response regulator